jgi:hypothetical protein
MGALKHNASAIASEVLASMISSILYFSPNDIGVKHSVNKFVDDDLLYNNVETFCKVF